FFEQHVRTVLADKCVACHGDQKPKGGLRLDSRDGLHKGGENGPVVVPGDPDQSRLVRAVRRAGDGPHMPPKEPLPADQVARLAEWVKMGAPDPRGQAAGINPAARIDLAQARTFWSFRPVRDAAPPPVRAAAWPRTP